LALGGHHFHFIWKVRQLPLIQQRYKSVDRGLESASGLQISETILDT
jgi:hypothetical protein